MDTIEYSLKILRDGIRTSTEGQLQENMQTALDALVDENLRLQQQLDEREQVNIQTIIDWCLECGLEPTVTQVDKLRAVLQQQEAK